MEKEREREAGGGEGREGKILAVSRGETTVHVKPVHA